MDNNYVRPCYVRLSFQEEICGAKPFPTSKAICVVKRLYCDNLHHISNKHTSTSTKDGVLIHTCGYQNYYFTMPTQLCLFGQSPRYYVIRSFSVSIPEWSRSNEKTYLTKQFIYDKVWYDSVSFNRISKNDNTLESFSIRPIYDDDNIVLFDPDIPDPTHPSKEVWESKREFFSRQNHHPNMPDFDSCFLNK